MGISASTPAVWLNCYLCPRIKVLPMWPDRTRMSANPAFEWTRVNVVGLPKVGPTGVDRSARSPDREAAVRID
jgi:hypothetical protein